MVKLIGGPFDGMDMSADKDMHCVSLMKRINDDYKVCFYLRKSESEYHYFDADTASEEDKKYISKMLELGLI